MTRPPATWLVVLALALPLSVFGCGEDGSGASRAGVAAADSPARTTADRSESPDDRSGTPNDVPDTARVILVTGSTGGLGREVARRLAAGGARVIVHGRDVERGTGLVREIETSGAGSARFFRADFAHLDSVRALADSVRRHYDRLDVLVNNAGILLGTAERPVSSDGHELHFQVNYLAGYLLTHELLPLLKRSAPARVVNVSSRSADPIDFDDVMLESGYSAGRAYGQSKLAQIMFTFTLAERLEGSGVTVNALHPASLMDTDLVKDIGMEPRSSVAEGARAVMHLIDGEDVGTGHYYRRMERARAPEAQAYDGEARARLDSISRELTGLPPAGGS